MKKILVAMFITFILCFSIVGYNQLTNTSELEKEESQSLLPDEPDRFSIN